MSITDSSDRSVTVTVTVTVGKSRGDLASAEIHAEPNLASDASRHSPANLLTMLLLRRLTLVAIVAALLVGVAAIKPPVGVLSFKALQAPPPKPRISISQRIRRMFTRRAGVQQVYVPSPDEYRGLQLDVLVARTCPEPKCFELASERCLFVLAEWQRCKRNCITFGQDRVLALA